MAIELSFADSGLRRLCEQSSFAQRKLGPDCARKLRTRLADIGAATAVSDLVAGDPHPLKGDRQGQFSVSLHGGVRLVFEPDHDPVPILESGGINWGAVNKVRIIFIGDYHD